MKKGFLIGSVAAFGMIAVFFLVMAFSERFQISIISPQDSTSVFSDFTLSMFITPSEVHEADIYIDGSLYKIYGEEDIKSIDISGSKLWSIPVKMDTFPSGGHSIQIYLKGGVFTKNNNKRIFLNCYKIHPDPVKPTEAEYNAVQSFLADKIQNLFIKLNNVRYAKENWQRSTEYTLTKKEVYEANVPGNIRERTFNIVSAIEDGKSYERLSSAVNELNYELQEQGYPFIAVLIDNTNESKYRTTLLLTYKISEVYPVKADSQTVNTFLMKRMDRLDVQELFNGAVQENSPYAYVLEDQATINAKDISGFLTDDNSIAIKSVTKKTNGNMTKEEVSEIIKGIKSEIRSYPSKNDAAFDISVRDIAIHESRHALDYRLGNKLSKSVVDLLSHIYNKPPSENKSDDIQTIKTAFETLLRINPEFSALLYTLAKNEGNRKYSLLKLFDYISDSYYDNTPYSWAAKLIFARLAEQAGNSFHGNIVYEPFAPNKKEWSSVFMSLMRLEPAELGNLADTVYAKEF